MWAATLGVNPVLFEKSMQASKNSGWTNNLQLLLNANTSKDGGEVGRPQSDDGQLTDSGERNRNQ